MAFWFATPGDAQQHAPELGRLGHKLPAHPHGGGEGRTSGGRHPVTPWGKPTKGARTRNNKQTDKMIIRSRHAKKKR